MWRVGKVVVLSGEELKALESEATQKAREEGEKAGRDLGKAAGYESGAIDTRARVAAAVRTILELSNVDPRELRTKVEVVIAETEKKANDLMAQAEENRRKAAEQEFLALDKGKELNALTEALDFTRPIFEE